MRQDSNNEAAIGELLYQLIRFKGKEFQLALPLLFEAYHAEDSAPGVEFCEYKTKSHTWKCGISFSGFTRWRKPTPTEPKHIVVEVLPPLVFATLWLRRGDADPYQAFLAHFEKVIEQLKRKNLKKKPSKK